MQGRHFCRPSFLNRFEYARSLPSVLHNDLPFLKFVGHVPIELSKYLFYAQVHGCTDQDEIDKGEDEVDVVMIESEEEDL